MSLYAPEMTLEEHLVCIYAELILTKYYRLGVIAYNGTLYLLEGLPTSETKNKAIAARRLFLNSFLCKAADNYSIFQLYQQ